MVMGDIVHKGEGERERDVKNNVCFSGIFYMETVALQTPSYVLSNRRNSGVPTM